MQALARRLPRLAAQIPWVALGDWPTPIEAVRVDGGVVWVKDEGRSNARYGGNKIRTLEVWLGHARARGARRVWAIGAYGSNHAIATLLHAPTAGLEAGAILFPQPASEWAIENCGALLATGAPIIGLHHLAEVPLAALRVARDRHAIVMPPGGATPTGTLGALSAAFELAEQVDAGACAPPRRIVLAIGSTCTTAGLLAGLALAHAVGAWRWPVPIVHGVRVTRGRSPRGCGSRASHVARSRTSRGSAGRASRSALPSSRAGGRRRAGARPRLRARHRARHGRGALADRTGSTASTRARRPPRYSACIAPGSARCCSGRASRRRCSRLRHSIRCARRPASCAPGWRAGDYFCAGFAGSVARFCVARFCARTVSRSSSVEIYARQALSARSFSTFCA